MLAIAVALLVAAGPPGPFDGRYALKGAPAECKLPQDNPDTFARFTSSSFDQYEAHCRWGALKAAGAGAWTAKGHCSIEGNDTPGSFHFTAKGDTLAMKGPDGVTSDFKRCRRSDRRANPPSQERPMIRKATAQWKGTGRDGTGSLTTASNVLDATPYSYKTRFEDGKGTNPEELIAAAHAGCFTMALAFALQAKGVTPDQLHTEAAVSLDPDGAGFKISKSALTLKAKIPGIDEATFQAIAKEAEANCPVSKLFKAEINLDATLES